MSKWENSLRGAFHSTAIMTKAEKLEKRKRTARKKDKEKGNFLFIGTYRQEINYFKYLL